MIRLVEKIFVTEIKLFTVFLVLILFLYGFTTPLLTAPLGVKLGFTASAFNYTDREMDPYTTFDIDLRPYLGYDIEWVQLGNQKPLFAPFVSCYVDVKIADRYFCRPEISITQKGVNFSQFDYERILYKVKITYLQVPLLLGYQVVSKDHYQVDLYFGGSGALKLNASKTVGYHQSDDQKFKIENVRNFDVSFIFGFDLKWNLFGACFMFDTRAFLGLSDIFSPIEHQSQLYHHTQKTKNAGFMFSLGYEFEL